MLGNVLENCSSYDEGSRSSGSDSLVIAKVGMVFQVDREYEKDPYLEIPDIEWEIIFVDGNTIKAKAVYPLTAIDRWTYRDFSNDYDLVCRWINVYNNN